jgi:hypothetical protein
MAAKFLTSRGLVRFSRRTLLHADRYIMFVAVHLKCNGEKFFRAVKGFIIFGNKFGDENCTVSSLVM